MNAQYGRFITIEGIEGVGKTTNVQFVAQYLKNKGIPLVVTREPGGTPLAELLRDTLLSPRDEQVSEITELLVMFAARAQHIKQVIEPALAAGKWVLCDRFTDATYAYQGGGRGIAKEKIKILEKMVQDKLQPDLTLLLNAPVEIGLKRALKRSAADRFEQETTAFFNRVAAVYLERAREFPQRFTLIDATQPLTAVQEEIKTTLDRFLS